MAEVGGSRLAPAPPRSLELPALPLDIWVRILQLIFTEELTPLKGLARLQLVSRTVLAAVRSLPIVTEVISEAALRAARPLLVSCPCSRLYLSKSVDGESLLRDPGFKACSRRTLTSLRAVVACTDTLGAFPALETLVLEAGAIQRFYPSVLGSLPSLRSLSLVRFPLMELWGLPTNVLQTLKEVHVTPRPLALRCAFHLALPPRLHLDRCVIHGSFKDITSPASAAVVDADVHTLARQGYSWRIEAQTLNIRVPCPASSRRRPLSALDLLCALCCEDATWKQLDLRLLDHRVRLVPYGPPTQGQERFEVAQSVALHPEDVLVAAYSVPNILATLSWKISGICRYPVLVLTRFTDLGSSDGDE